MLNLLNLKSYSEKTLMAKTRPPLFLRTLGVHRPVNRAVRDDIYDKSYVTMLSKEKATYGGKWINEIYEIYMANLMSQC